jgi:WD40 repeat protein
VTLWRWEDEDPVFSTNSFHPEIEYLQKSVKFNDSQNEFATTGSRRVVFWSWDPSVKGL